MTRKFRFLSLRQSEANISLGENIVSKEWI